DEPKDKKDKTQDRYPQQGSTQAVAPAVGGATDHVVSHSAASKVGKKRLVSPGGYTRGAIAPSEAAFVTSSRVTVAVPTLPTTMLAARLARWVACSSVEPAARAMASVLITVSPAPVTSNTVCATAGMWAGGKPLRRSDIPWAPRVTRPAGPPKPPANWRPTSRRLLSPVISCLAKCSTSWMLGLTTVAPRYLA